MKNIKDKLSRTLVLVISLLTLASLSGCQLSNCTRTGAAEGKIEGGEVSGRVEGRITCPGTPHEARNDLFSPLQNLVYAFTEQTFEDFDFEEFNVKLDITNGYVPGQTGTIEINLTEDGTTLVTDSFPISISNGIATLSNPQAVKLWASSYDGIMTGFTYEISDIGIQSGGGGITIVKTDRYGTEVYASQSAYVAGPNDGCFRFCIEK
ncbi:hypothetical protein QWY77_00495 [Thalassotalea ponticola]|uniref:hypothetical protein n=1 Tax=Thalassotalea ponticola TaxID=1523392 RepID=UPI0025B39751|nr:hypothetical protein [Thalassotalea ponticola]MDN3651262.1 hypothetical protein [Thalassotalea ponticola]